MVTAMGAVTAENRQATAKTTIAGAMALPTAETPQEQHDASKAGMPTSLSTAESTASTMTIGTSGRSTRPRDATTRTPVDCKKNR
jgi:hypothetical protein